MSTSKQFILPFVVKSESREEPFSVEAERAAVFALSELERKSGGLNSKSEKISYILKVGYPLWFIARDNFTYVFDGLNRMQHNWVYCEAAQEEFKIEDLEGLFRIREEYTKFLVNYQKKECQVQNSKELLCEGLITGQMLLEELGRYRKEANEVYNQTAGLLLPVLEEKKITTTIDQIEEVQLAFREKIEKLKQLLKLISKTTKEYIEGLNFESKSIAEEAEAKIKAQKEIINPKIEKINNNYKKQAERLENSTNKEQQPLKKQKTRIEKSIKETEKNIERYSKQVKIQSQKGNKRSEDSLKKKLKKEKQELEELQKQHKKLENQLKTLTEQKTNEATMLKNVFDREVQKERQPIATLETLRDEKQEILKQESLKLEKLTQPVLEEIEQRVSEWEKRLTNMKLLGLKTSSEQKNNALLYVPFYITSYSRADLKDKRYFVLSPSTVGNLGFSSKFKGYLGRAKIKDVLNKRFEAVSSLGEKLQEITSSANRDFEAQIERLLLQKNNILDQKPQLKEGLLLLKEEGWLSETEQQTILSTI
jgi:myosin heavy subunit